MIASVELVTKIITVGCAHTGRPTTTQTGFTLQSEHKSPEMLHFMPILQLEGNQHSDHPGYIPVIARARMYIMHEVASSPGHSQFFNVAR